MKTKCVCVVLGVLLLAGFPASVSAQENVKVEVKVEDETQAEVGNKQSQPVITPINDEQTVKETIRTPIRVSDDDKAVNRRIILPVINDGDPLPDNPLVVGADFVAKGGTQVVLKNGARLLVSGNITNNGTLSSIGGSNVCLNGLGNQVLTGATTFDTLTVCNEGTLTLGSSTTVNSRLELTSGKVVLGANALTLGPAATINGVSAANYLVTNGSGGVVRAIQPGANFMFPIAPNTTTYNPITITLQADDPAETFTVNVATGVANASGVDTSLCVHRTWNIAEQTPGGNHAKLAFQWHTNDDGSNFVPMFSSAFHYAGSRYFETDYLIVPNTPPIFVGTMITFGAENFSPYIVGQAGGLPVQLAIFTGVELPGRGVRLDWRTLTEVNNYGFFVQRKRQTDSLWADVQNSFVPGHGTTLEPHDYLFIDTTVRRGDHSYRLRQIDLNGTQHFSEAINVNVVTAVGEELPRVFALHQNYPNPFNPTTTIRFALPKTTPVQLEVYNIIGQRVATLVNEIRQAGYYNELFNANNIASGVYIYRLQAEGFTDVKKLMVLK